MTDASAWASAVAAYGVGPPKAVLFERPVEDASWPKLVRLARDQRLLGLVQAAARDGVLALSTEQRELMERAHGEVVAETARAEEATVHVADHLASCGIQCRVLKGPALAHLDYPSAALRPFVHVSLLVESSRFIETLEQLRTMGYERAHAEPAGGFDARFRKGTMLFAESGVPVEVHRTIADGLYAMIVDHDELFPVVSSFEIDGRSLCALGPEERLLHACFEARVGDTRPLLVRLRDVVQLVLSHDLDIGRIEHLSTAWSAQSLVAEAVRRAWNLLGVTDIVPLSAWAGTHPTTRKERRRLRAYHTARSRTLVSIPTLGAIRPRRAVPAYLRAVAFPDRAYLEGHYSGHVDRLWHIAKATLLPRTGTSPERDRLSLNAIDGELTDLSWTKAAPNPA
jgi:Uncharacterised nucleotidyltransferase